MGLFSRLKGSNDSKNFGYLKNQIIKSNEIVLDCDIVLGDDEIEEFRDGIVITTINLTIDGNGHSIDARGLGPIFFTSSRKNLTIKNLTLKNSAGPAIYNANGNLKLVNCKFQGNVSEECAGAIDNHKGGEIYLEDCVFKSNTSHVLGGAVVNRRYAFMSFANCQFLQNISHRGGAILNAGEITIDGALFALNFTKSESGGAIDNEDTGVIAITNSLFRRNGSSASGGAIFNVGKMDLKGVEFKKNWTKRFSGGAIDNQPSGKLYLEECLFNSNSSESTAGAIANWGTVTAQSVPFIKNKSKLDVCAVDNNPGGLLTFSYCEFENNIASKSSNVVFNGGESARFFNCIFSKHNGGLSVVLSKSELIFADCIFKENRNMESLILSAGDGNLIGGEISDNSTKSSQVHIQDKHFTISKTKFENNISDKFACDVLNESELTLHSPKFTGAYCVLNKGHIDVKKLSHEEAERIIKNEGSIDEFTIPPYPNYDFSYLSEEIEKGGTVVLDSDINIAGYERDFFEGGIEIDCDSLVIDGAGHTVDAGGRSRIFHIRSGNVTIKNMIFKNGFSSNKLLSHAFGGGAIKVVENAVLKLQNCTFMDNNSDNNGGAVQNNGTLYSIKNQYIGNCCEFKGGAVHSNGRMYSKDDVFTDNSSKIAGAIYNAKRLSLNGHMDFSNNESDFDHPIYNADSITADGNFNDFIFNTHSVNGPDYEWESFTYLLELLSGSDEISLERDIRLEYGEIDFDEIVLDNVVFDGNGHIIDFNHLNLNFKVTDDVVFRNVIFMNSFLHKGPLFKVNMYGHHSRKKPSFILENVTFINNRAAFGNALIKNKEGGLKITDSNFYNSCLQNSSAISNEGYLFRVEGCKFTNNESMASGAVIDNRRLKTINSITNSIFRNNVSAKSGGVMNFNIGSVFHISDCAFIYNVSKVAGGAIVSWGDLKISRCLFQRNLGDRGGAIFNAFDLDLDDCIFGRNVAISGGGLFNQANAKSRSCVFYSNVSAYGGAICGIRKEDLKFDDCSFDANVPDDVKFEK